jgi:ABC-type transporter Mla subunit MlaD
LRRVLSIAAAVASVVVAVALLTGRSGASYRVDAVFDTAQGVVPGEAVRIAGATVGSVRAIHLAPGPKARVELEMDRSFAPFRADAHCRILPDGLINGSSVECSPGTAAAPLPRGPGAVPVIAVPHTSEPVTLQALLDVFAAPASSRLQLVLHDLGLATSARGEDINAILRRANPALTEAGRVLAVVSAQRHEIATAIGQTDQVIARLARDKRQIRRFVAATAAVASASSRHRGALSESVRRLPPLLASARRSFGALDRVSLDASPALADLRAATPALRTITGRLPALVAAAAPAERALGSTADEGVDAAGAARPVIGDLRKLTAGAGPAAGLLDRLLVDGRRRGAVEGLLSMLYATSTATSLYDGSGHLASVQVRILRCLTDPSSPGCDANFNRPGSTMAPPRVGARATGAGASPSAIGAREPRLDALLDYLLK